jgi:prolyl oligopeptidase
MAALLQAATATDPAERPILLRLETKAGHGAGKPQAKVLDEQVDIWSFLGWQLGLP